MRARACRSAVCKSKRAPPPAPPSLFGGQYGRPRPPAGAMYAPPVCAHVCVCVLRQAPICAPCLCAWPVSACVCTCVHLFPSVPTPPAWYWFVILPALFVSDAHVRVCMSPQPTRGPDFVLSCSLLSPSVFFPFPPLPVCVQASASGPANAAHGRAAYGTAYARNTADHRKAHSRAVCAHATATWFVHPRVRASHMRVYFVLEE